MNTDNFENIRRHWSITNNKDKVLEKYYYFDVWKLNEKYLVKMLKWYNYICLKNISKFVSTIKYVHLLFVILNMLNGYFERNKYQSDILI